MSNPLLEITTFPEVLCDASVKTDSLQLYGSRIGDLASRIDTQAIRKAFAWPFPKFSELWPDEYKKSPNSFVGYTQIQTADGRIFYGNGDKSKEYEWLLADRIPRVVRYGGSLVTAEGHYYIIKNSHILGFQLNTQAIDCFRSLSKRDIVAQFGLPNFIRERWGDDPELFSTELFYQRGVKLFYKDYDKQFGDIEVRRDVREFVFGDLDKPWDGIKPYIGQPTCLFD